VTKSRPYLRAHSGSTHFGGQPGAGQRRSSLKPPALRWSLDVRKVEAIHGHLMSGDVT